MMISGRRTEQLDIFCHGFTSDFPSLIVVQHIRFFHGALQLIFQLRQLRVNCSSNARLEAIVNMLLLDRSHHCDFVPTSGA